MKKSVLLTQGAIIAAVYFVLTLLVAPLAFGPLQFRVSEALMDLPMITIAAVPGLFVGCLLFNLLYPTGLGPIDVIFGSLATLIAAVLIYWLGRRMNPELPQLKFTNLKTWISPLPAVISNGLIVGGYLLFLLPDVDQVTVPAVLGNMLSIAVCEAVVVYTIGLAILFILKQSKTFLRLCGYTVSV